MKKQFVPYEIALKLKELSFDEECLAYFSNDKYHDLHHSCENVMEGDFVINNYNELKAPLWQQVIDWIRERYKINIFFDCEMNLSSMEIAWFKYRYKIYIERVWVNKGIYNGFNTYEEAREQAILKAIELWKNNS